MKKIIFYTVSIVALSTAVNAQDIKTIVQRSVAIHPSIMEKAEQVNQADARYMQERSAYLPRVDMSADKGRDRRTQHTRTTVFTSGVDGTVKGHRRDRGLTVRQTIFDGLEGYFKMQKSELEKSQAEKSTLEIKTQVAFDTGRAFVDVRRYKRLMELAHENIKLHKQILGKVKEEVRVGKLTVADESTVASRLFDAEAALQDIIGNYDNAVARYINQSGLEPQDLERVSIDYARLPQDVNAALVRTKENNPTLKVSSESIRVAEANLDSTYGAFLPKVDISFQNQRTRNAGGVDGKSKDKTTLVNASLNLSNGGRDLGRNRELRSVVTASKYRFQNEILRTEQETRISFGDMVSAKGQAIALRNAVTSKKSVRDSYLAQFQAGTSTYIQILESSHDYFLAKGSQITAEASEDSAALRLLAFTGDILTYFDIPLGEEYAPMKEYPVEHPYKTVALKDETPQPELKESGTATQTEASLHTESAKTTEESVAKPLATNDIQLETTIMDTSDGSYQTIAHETDAMTTDVSKTDSFSDVPDGPLDITEANPS